MIFASTESAHRLPTHLQSSLLRSRMITYLARTFEVLRSNDKGDE